MYGLVITGTVTLIAIAILVKTLTAGKSRPPRHPYQKQIALFSPDDQVFHRALTEAVGENYVIFGKIRVADIIVPKKGTPRAEARRAFAPIAGRHFDFVLCEKHNLTVACTIQLTDKTNPARKPDLGNPIKAICETVALPSRAFTSRPNILPRKCGNGCASP